MEYNEEEIGEIVKECFNIVIKRKYTEENLIIKKGEKDRGPRTVSKEKSEKNLSEIISTGLEEKQGFKKVYDRRR